ncbi:FtsX-like permease family protein [Streptomyces cellulosae]
MLRPAAQTLRHRKGGFLATFVALAAGVAVLMTCALLVESGWRHQGDPHRFGAAVAVVADRDLTVDGPTVLGETERTTVLLPERGSVPEKAAGALADVPGVDRAVGDRRLVVTTTAAPELPTTGHGWSSTALAPYRLLSGRPPRTDGEIAVDARLADGTGLTPGATTEVVTGGVGRTYEVSGVVDADDTASGRAALFFTDTHAAALDPHPGRYDAVGVLTAPDADRDAVLASVRRIADAAGATAYTGDDRGLGAEPDSAAGRSLALGAGAAFAGYAAAVAGFVVAGTAGLSVRHRRRDLALLRAVAATPGQVRSMLLAEAGLLALLAGAVGVPAGLLATHQVRDVLVSRGFLPDHFAVQGGALSAAAAVVTVAVVALLSTWIAALRVTRIRPTEALGEAAVEPVTEGRVRLVCGLACVAGALSLTVLTGATDGQTALGAAMGMLYLFVLGVALLAPWINQAAARLLGPVLRTVWGNSGYSPPPICAPTPAAWSPCSRRSCCPWGWAARCGSSRTTWSGRRSCRAARASWPSTR